MRTTGGRNRKTKETLIRRSCYIPFPMYVGERVYDKLNVIKMLMVWPLNQKNFFWFGVFNLTKIRMYPIYLLPNSIILRLSSPPNWSTKLSSPSPAFLASRSWRSIISASKFQGVYKQVPWILQVISGDQEKFLW